MKIVINVDFGGFGLGVAKEFRDFVDAHYDDRTNEKLVKFVEENPEPDHRPHEHGGKVKQPFN